MDLGLQGHLPDILSLEKSEQSLKEGFQQAGQLLSRYLERVESAVATCENFSCDLLNLVAIGLFSKLRHHYYTTVVLELHGDELGIQFLTEHLYETAIALTYWVEEADESTLTEYITASLSEAQDLLAEVEVQLHNFPTHQGLRQLKQELQSLIDQEQQLITLPTPEERASAYLGLQELNATAQLATTLGLNALIDPARTLRLRIPPASWLDVQLNYLQTTNSYLSNEISSERQFRRARDIAHTCLHATRALLEETIAPYQEAHKINLLNLQTLFADLSLLFEWFHEAYRASGLLSSEKH